MIEAKTQPQYAHPAFGWIMILRERPRSMTGPETNLVCCVPLHPVGLLIGYSKLTRSPRVKLHGTAWQRNGFGALN